MWHRLVGRTVIERPCCQRSCLLGERFLHRLPLFLRANTAILTFRGPKVVWRGRELSRRAVGRALVTKCSGYLVPGVAFNIRDPRVAFNIRDPRVSYTGSHVCTPPVWFSPGIVPPRHKSRDTGHEHLEERWPTRDTRHHAYMLSSRLQQDPVVWRSGDHEERVLRRTC